MSRFDVDSSNSNTGAAAAARSSSVRVPELESAELAAKAGTADQIISQSLYCPITGELMKNPVIAADGFTYERDAIQGWINTNLAKNVVISPMTGLALNNFTLMENKTLKSIIMENKPSNVPGLSDAHRLNQLEQRFELFLKFASNVSTVVSVAAGSSGSPEQQRYGFFIERVIKVTEEQQAQLQIALVEACEAGDINKVRSLVVRGAKLRLPDSTEKLPLGAALFSLNKELIDYIYENIKPDHAYFGRCVSSNLTKYGSQTPEWKNVNNLCLKDLCDGYLGKEGRQIIFSDWLWQKMSCHRACWKEILLSPECTTAVTHNARNWRFDSNNTLVQELIGLDQGRGTVWGALIDQYNYCVQSKKNIDDFIAYALPQQVMAMSPP